MSKRKYLSLKNKGGSFLFILFWLSPYLLLIPYINPPIYIESSEFVWALKNTLLQSVASAFLILIFGFWGVYGLNAVQAKSLKAYRWVEAIYLLPSFVPTIFILLTVFKIMDPFPFGWLGVTLVHTLIYSGLASIFILQSLQNKVFPLESISRLDAVSPSQFLLRVALPILKFDLLRIFMSFFTLCFVSFSVPLVTAGGKGTTIEVLIYEKIRIQGDWSGALALCLIQAVLLFTLAQIRRPRLNKNHMQPVAQYYFRQMGAILFFVLLASCILYTQFSGFREGWNQLQQIPHLMSLIINYSFGTVLLSFAAGLSVFALCYWLLYLLPQALIAQFIFRYVPPASSLVAFVLLMLGSFREEKVDYIKILFALLIVNVPYVLKSYFFTRYENLSQQVDVARALGASKIKIVHQILLPQMSKTLGFISGAVALWVSGDFAIPKIISGKELTLAQLMESLLSHYRFYAATVLGAWLLVIGFFIFFIFTGWGYVYSQKFKL